MAKKNHVMWRLGCLLGLGLLASPFLVPPAAAYIPADDHFLCDFPQPLKIYRYYRWYPEEMPLKVYIPPVSYATDNPSMYYPLVQQAFLSWSQYLPQMQFQWTGNPAEAQIQVIWHERFPESESAWGMALFPTPYQTPQGIRHRSELHLAVRAQDGTGMVSGSQLFSREELLAIATHEVGHVLGLPHSRNRDDIMTSHLFRLSANSAWQISQRDVATLKYLYSLPRNLEIPPCNGH